MTALLLRTESSSLGWRGRGVVVGGRALAAGGSRPSGLGPGLGAIVREGRRDPGCWEEVPCAARGGHWSGVGRRSLEGTGVGWGGGRGWVRKALQRLPKLLFPRRFLHLLWRRGL